jgi:hypothetical protein
MIPTRLPAHVLPWVRRVGPYGWAAAGLIAGALLAREYLRRTRLPGHREEGDAVARWEGEGGTPPAWEP